MEASIILHKYVILMSSTHYLYHTLKNENTNERQHLPLKFWG